ncbi:MAG: metallophosphoesterase family protein [Candidatus Micrarchaeia archaeon]
MKVLAFSDIHDDESALESLARLIPGYDMAFICGDISHKDSFTRDVLGFFPRSFIIPGNWDSRAVNSILSASPQWLHMKRAELDGGLNAVGFGYSNPTPFGTYGELSEAEIYRQMSGLSIDPDTILLLHCPPKGHFDSVDGRAVGSEAVLRVIEEKKPLAALFGHIHEHQGFGMLGGTSLVKLPPADEMRACSLSINNKRISAEFISL